MGIPAAADQRSIHADDTTIAAMTPASLMAYAEEPSWFSHVLALEQQVPFAVFTHGYVF